MDSILIGFLASIGAGGIIALIIYTLVPRNDIKVIDPDQLSSEDFTASAWKKIKEFSETLK